jgi:hypothetical protein
MTTYLIKMILCSGVLLLFYFLLLEKEKMHHFKRFYLLTGIVFSFLVPFISIEGPSEILPFAEPVYVVITNDNTISVAGNPTISADVKEQSWKPDVLVLIYVITTAFFLSRFAKNILKLFTKIRTERKLPYRKAKLVLCYNHLTPFSFLNYIFVDKDEFEKGCIEKEILCHELAHARQKHSWDILFTEWLLCFAWFNPFLYGYKKAIRLNHEFLADDAVVKNFHNTTSYQYLLLNKISRVSHSLLASSFNYMITKKRLIMMTKSTSPVMATLKQIVLLPLLALLIFLFSTKLIAQVVQEPVKKSVSANTRQNTNKKDTVESDNWVRISIGYTKEGASEELLKEYESLVNKYKRPDSLYWKDFRNMSEEDRSRMETIYKQMSIEQQEEQIIGFFKYPPPLPKVVPTKEQLNNFKNPEVYGIWINGKRTPNEELNKYDNTDFSQVFVSKLYGPAKKGRIYSYQVDMMTNEYYKKYYTKAKEQQKKSAMVVLYRKGKSRGSVRVN